MPHHKSAAKRILTNAKANRRNTAARTRMRSAVKTVLAAKTRAEGEAAYRAATAVLDRTAAKGVIKKETANRRKSRLARQVQRLSA
jgi:small subunit ribosomal protein S20